MRKTIITAVLAFVLSAVLSPASASNCPSSTVQYTFSSGTTAVANEVNSNFSGLLTCANSYLAPIASPSFTGVVGIGVTTPQAKLNILSVNNSTTNDFVFSNGTNGTYQNGISNRQNNTTLSGNAMFLRIGDTTASGQNAVMQLNGNGGVALGTSYAQEFTVPPANGLVVSGSVGIGTSTPGKPLDVIGDIRTSTCVLFPGGGSGTSCPSDISLKRDVHPFTLGLDAVVGLKPVNFYFNGLGGTTDDGVLQLGLLAQDVELVAPSLVGVREVKLKPSDRNQIQIKTVNYIALTYMLINSVKELKAANDSYAAQLAALRKQVADLEARAGVRTARLAVSSAR